MKKLNKSLCINRNMCNFTVEKFSIDNYMKQKKTFVRPMVTVSPFAAADILAGSGFEAGQLDFGGNGTSGTTTGGGSSNGGSFDWNTGQLGG